MLKILFVLFAAILILLTAAYVFLAIVSAFVREQEKIKRDAESRTKSR